MKKLLLVPVILGAVASIVSTRNDVEIDVIIISVIMACFIFGITYALCFILAKEKNKSIFYGGGIFGLSLIFWIIYGLFLGATWGVVVSSVQVGGNALTLGVTVFSSVLIGPIVYWLTKPKSA